MSTLLDIESFPTTDDVGFIGGRDNFRAFCRDIFRSKDPRFIRNAQNQLVVFRHADLQLFGVAPEIGNLPIGKMYPNRFNGGEGQTRPPGWEIGDVISKQVFTFNPPLHGPARRILTNWLGPKQVVQMEGIAREIVRDIVDRMHDGEAIDFVEMIAEVVIIRFWSVLLYLTDGEAVAIGQCAREMTRLFHANRSPEDVRALDTAFADYARLLELAAQRGLERGDPAMLEIAAKLQTLDFPDDPFELGLVPKTLGGFLAGNLVDGVHTAALAAANTFYALVNNPEALAAVRKAPDLIPRAIAEALRLEPPVLLLSRYVLRDFHFDDLVLPAGNIVTMVWAAGNHDPAAFPEPERFDLNRSQIGLTTFGSGIHICPGRYVGVMLTRVILEEFVSLGIALDPVETGGEWFAAHKMNQLKVFPVRLSRSA